MPYLARIEGGVGNVSVALVHKLGSALNVSVEALLSDEAIYRGDLLILGEFQQLQKPPPNVPSRQRRQIMAQPESRPGARDSIAQIGLRRRRKVDGRPQACR
ncbi:hypothetical protein KNO81_36830 [Paraburkholderia sediminicola]|nr:hypothetical protein [Paraburkholderia sediminicola]